ncbi:hypothetical protein EC968_001141 [Mortierella alpina]|nr:hypothetical protein EC968_001141 [Mortierella alpina]
MRAANFAQMPAENFSKPLHVVIPQEIQNTALEMVSKFKAETLSLRDAVKAPTFALSAERHWSMIKDYWEDMEAPRNAMAKFSIIPLFVLAMILSVVAAASQCYCVNCSGQRCNPNDAATRAVWKEANWWEMSNNRDKAVVYVPEDDQWFFHQQCTKHGAMGGTCV